jgi:ketosteroid isomerase-like protein
MSEANLEIVRSLWEPLKGVDVTTIDWEGDAIGEMLRAYSPDVELRWAAGWVAEREYRGHDGLLRAYREWVEPFSNYRVEALDYIDAGDRVVVPTRQWGTGRASGAAVEIEVTHVFEFRGSVIVRVDEYASLEEALEAAGQRGAS